MDAVFHEEQRFRQRLLLILVAFLAGLSWYGLIVQILLKKPFGTNPAPDVVVWAIWLVFGIAFPLFFLSLRMITDVRPDGLEVRFPPFHRRSIPLEEVQSVEVREYRAIKEYGGWGIRHSSKHGTAYNVRGNRGVQLILKNGKRVLIGSQEPDRLADVLRDFLRHRRSTG